MRLTSNRRETVLLKLQGERFGLSSDVCSSCVFSPGCPASVRRLADRTACGEKGCIACGEHEAFFWRKPHKGHD